MNVRRLSGRLALNPYPLSLTPGGFHVFPCRSGVEWAAVGHWESFEFATGTPQTSISRKGQTHCFNHKTAALRWTLAEFWGTRVMTVPVVQEGG